jgi:hypothetical protein
VPCTSLNNGEGYEVHRINPVNALDAKTLSSRHGGAYSRDPALKESVMRIILPSSAVVGLVAMPLPSTPKQAAITSNVD